MITQQKEKYSYGYKMGSERLRRQKIMLPIDESENPNWEFMKNYIKVIELEKTIKLLEYFK